MACEKFGTTLNGVEYNYTQLPASKSLKLKFQLAKVFGSSLPILLNGVGKNDETQIQLLADAITKALSLNSADDITGIIVESVRTVQIGTNQIDVDKQFSGDLYGLYALMFWVLKKEYGSFLVEVIGLLDETQTPIKERGLRSISQI